MMNNYTQTNWKNIEDMDIFLDMYNLLSLNCEEIQNMSGPIMSNKIRAVIKTPSSKKSPRPDDFMAEFYQTFKRRMNTNSTQSIQKRRGGNLSQLL